MGVLPTPGPITDSRAPLVVVHPADRVDQALANFSPALPLLIAYSGGADSTALLVACHLKWPGQVSALHVNHNLQTAAMAFTEHCQRQCQQLGVPLQVISLDARHVLGQSPEEAARVARYAAIDQAAQQVGAASVALAQHQDDQVETLLLALSRGAGLPGLSAMPSVWHRASCPGVTFYRPFLTVPGAALREWLAQRLLTFVEDPSNQNTRYTRNRIRHQLMPALEAVFPGYRQAFTRSSGHIAQAQRLLVELASQDLASVGNPPNLGKLQRLSPDRQANLLRHWLAQHHQTAASTAQLVELQRQIQACTTRGHSIAIKVGSGSVVRKGPDLDWYNP